MSCPVIKTFQFTTDYLHYINLNFISFRLERDLKVIKLRQTHLIALLL